jgi:hypothetical protein
MAECEVCAPRTPSLTLDLWATIMQLPANCQLTPAQTADVLYTLEQVDEDVANYAGWWPTPTAICEEIPVAVRYGTCLFTRAGTSRWVTLRYGKVRAIESVEFLRRASAGCDPQGSCYSVETGAICLTDAEYGSVELNVQSQAICRCPADVERIRIRYTSGYCEARSQIGAQPFAYLLARYAATYLESPVLCGVDLTGDAWQTYSLTDTEAESTVTTETSHELTTHIDYEDNQVSVDEVVTDETDTTTTTNEDRALTTTRQVRRPENPLDRQSAFGLLPAQLALWRFLRSRRRMRAYRL